MEGVVATGAVPVVVDVVGVNDPLRGTVEMPTVSDELSVVGVNFVSDVWGIVVRLVMFEGSDEDSAGVDDELGVPVVGTP